VHVNNLGVDNLDVLPQLSVNNIPKRSEDISIDGVTPGIGVPTLLIPRDDGDDDEQQEESNAGELGLDFLGFSKREETLLGGGSDDGDLLDIVDLRKRGDGNGEKVDDSDSGPLDLGLRKRGDITDDHIDKEVDETIKMLKGVVKRDDTLFDDNILGGLLHKRDETLLGGGDDDGDNILDVVDDLRDKRDGTLLTDGDENGDGTLLGLVNLRKREQDSSVGGIGGFDISTPVLDAVNI
jgi:hypothetical protein